MRLTDLLSLSIVPRWSIVDHRRPQSVADHSFRVAVIARELFERLGHPPLTTTELWWCLDHDGPESRSGDVSGEFKRRLSNPAGWAATELAMCPWLGRDGCPSSDRLRLLKIVDDLETYTFIRKFGEGPHADRVANLIVHRLRDRCDEAKVNWSIPASIIDDILSDAGRW